MSLDPIRHEYDLRCSPEHAFDVYANRIGEWWHPDYSANPGTLTAVTIEAGAGGRVFATHSDLGEMDWGRVTVWEPGRCLAYSSVLGQARDHPSEVRVEFAPHGGGCRVGFTHGGWTDGNAADRPKFTDWPRILDRFADLANRSAAGQAF